jgi:hypothetical protein
MSSEKQNDIYWNNACLLNSLRKQLIIVIYAYKHNDLSCDEHIKFLLSLSLSLPFCLFATS